MNDVISVLSVDADEASQLALAAVAAQGLPYRLEMADSVGSAKRLLAAHRFDVILADSTLPDGTAFDLFDVTPESVVIVTIRPGDEDRAGRALCEGASDILIKDPGRTYLTRLPHRIDAALRHWHIERLLQNNEQLYRDLVEGTTDLIQSVAPDGRILFVNRAWRDTLGYTSDEVAALSIFDLIHPKGHAHYAALFPRIMAGEDVGDIDITLLTKDGREVAVEGRSTAHVEDGTAVAIRGIFRNVTERERAKATQRDMTALLDDALRHTHMMVVLLDPHFNFVWVNAAYAATCRHDPSFFPGKNHFALYPHAENQAIFQRVVDTGQAFFVAAKAFEFPDQPERGATYWDWSLVPTRSAAGTVTGLVFTLAEVTDRVLAELEVGRLNAQLEHLVDERTREARASEQRLRTIIETEPECVKVLSVNGELLEMNAAGLAMLEAESIEQVRQASLLGFVVPEHRSAFRGLLQRVIDGESGKLEFEVRGLRGTRRWLATHAAPVRDATGQVTMVLGITQDITDRKRAVLALAESEEQHRRLVTEMRDGVYVIDPQGVVTFANPAVASLMGVEHPDEVVGRSFLEFIEPTTIAEVAGYFRRAVETGHARDATTVRLVRPDGTRATIEVKSDVVTSGGTVVGIKGTMRDISERTLTEDALRLLSTGMAHLSGEAFFQTVSSQLPRLLGVDIGIVGRLLQGEPPRIRTLGLCVDGELQPDRDYDIRGTPCEAVLSREAAIFTDRVSDRFAGDAWLTRLGVAGYAAVPLFDLTGRTIGHVGVMSRKPLQHPDRMESILRLFAVRAAAEIERQRAEDRFVNLFEFAPDAIVMANLQGAVTLVNRRAEELFGWTRAELVGRALDTLIPKAFQHSHAAGRGDRPDGAAPHQSFRSHHDVRAIGRDGAEVAVDVSISPLDMDGDVHLVAAMRDVTVRKRLEAALSQARKMQMVGQLAGGIAHDFNNLLTVINGTAELAAASLGTGDPLRDELTTIHTAGVKAAALTKQLVAFSRQQILQPRVLNLSTVVTQMMGMLKRLLGEGVSLAINLAADIGHVKADRGQIEQVIVNLAVNARHAMPSGGTVTFETRNVELDEAFGRQRGVVVPPGPYVALIVSDTGIGMDEVTAARIFEPFFTTKGPGEGTGLGLAMAYGIVKQSDGFIWASSTVGHGTTMTIHLPRTLEEADSAPPPVLAAPAHGTETVLIAEDEDGLRALAVRILRSAGYTTLAAANGEEALRLLDRYDGPVHLLLTDVVMPGMSGPVLAERVRTSHPGVRVLFTSGHAGDAIVHHGVVADGVRFIGKPYTSAALTEKVREVLDAPLVEGHPPKLQ